MAWNSVNKYVERDNYTRKQTYKRDLLVYCKDTIQEAYVSTQEEEIGSYFYAAWKSINEYVIRNGYI